MNCTTLLMALVLMGVSHGLLSREKAIEKIAKRWCGHFKQPIIYMNDGRRSCSSFVTLTPKVLKIPRNTALRVALLGSREFHQDCVPMKIPMEPSSYSSALLEMLQKSLHFRTETVQVEKKVLNCSHVKDLNCVVKAIATGVADISICHQPPTSAATHHVAFLLSTLTTSHAFVFDPSKLSLTSDVFVLTFSGTLWICFLSAIILLIITFRFSTWLHSQVRPDHEPWTWVEVVLWATAAVCQQSYSRHPKGLSCRTTFIIGYLITYLLYTGFAAGVTSLLAVQGTDVQINVEDVLPMKLKVVRTAHTAHHPFLKGDYFKRQINYDLLLKQRRLLLVPNNKALFSVIGKKENTVGIGTVLALENFIHHELPNNKQSQFILSPIVHGETRESWIVRKNFPYRTLFNFWLLKIREAGLMSLAEDRYLEKAQARCCDEPGWSSAGLGNVLSAVYILLAGYFFSVFILFCEMAWFKKNASNQWQMRSLNDVIKHSRKKNLSKRS